jgi:ribosomal protein L29
MFTQEILILLELSAMALIRALRQVVTREAGLVQGAGTRALRLQRVAMQEHGLTRLLDKSEGREAPGRAWQAEELRRKSFSDLSSLWHACIRERNMLLTEESLAKRQQRSMPHPQRKKKVKLCMSRIKTVLTERADAQAAGRGHVRRRLMRVINSM